MRDRDQLSYVSYGGIDRAYRPMLVVEADCQVPVRTVTSLWELYMGVTLGTAARQHEESTPGGLPELLSNHPIYACMAFRTSF